MKKIIPFTILIIASLLVNCSNNSANTDNKSKVINFPKSGEDTLKASYFADTVIYIPLETTKKSFIKVIVQLWMNDSVILINDMGGGLLMFQQDGKFIRQIGKQGRGPGEYGKYIYHFDVIRDTIYISSTGRRGFLRYTFNGTFCDEIKLNYEPVYFSTTVDQKLACYRIEEGEIYVYNKNPRTPPDTITVEYGVTEGRYRYSFTNFAMAYLQKYSTGLLFYDYKSDTVWNITGDKKEPAFIFDMKDKLLPWDKQIEFCKGDFQGWENSVKAFQLIHLIPISSCMLVFQKHWTDTKPDAIYLNNTRTGEVKKFNTSYIYDDIVSKQKLTFFYFTYSADYLVADISPSKLLKNLNINKENNKVVPSHLWLNQMKPVKENDNPILVLIKIKKNL